MELAFVRHGPVGSASSPRDFEDVLSEYEATLRRLDNSQLSASVVAAT